jgi:NhaP-type Na+/H+ or K+/H+ antiporter
MELSGLGDYFREKKSQLVAGFMVGISVFILYAVVELIMWNTLNVTYALSYAVVAFFVYFVIRRLASFVMTKRKG